MASKKEGSETSSTAEYSNKKSESLVVTPAMGGRIMDMSDGVDKGGEIFASKHQQEDDDTNLNNNTEGWDGNVSGKEDDSSKSDTYDAQMMDSIEDKNEGDVTGEEDESDVCRGRELDDGEDEGTAGDDGYEADEEAE